jgi:hypothetical protein
MMDMSQQPEHSGPAVTQRQCSQFPKTSTAVSSAKPAPAPGTLTTPLAFSHLNVKAQTEARYRVSHSRTRQKRGPPSLL